jgi:hypothetical protein
MSQRYREQITIFTKKGKYKLDIEERDDSGLVMTIDTPTGKWFDLYITEDGVESY